MINNSSPTPYFSVVIPTYNRAGIISKTLNSVLRQTFANFEIIVVDNCSDDNTAEVMATYESDKRVIYLRNEKNFERSYSRNRGLRTSTGNFVTLLDSDDIMYPDCLKDAYEFSSQNPGYKFFHCLYNMIDENGGEIKKTAFKEIINQHKEICKGNFISCIGTFMDKELAHQFFFAEDRRMIGAEDYEIWFRVLAQNKLGRIDKINCGVTEHPERSVYSSMYENLGYQRQHLISLIHNDPVLLNAYKPYIGYINSNFYYHEAMYRLHTRQMGRSVNCFIQSVFKGKGMFFSQRFFGFIKNFIIGLIRKK